MMRTLQVRLAYVYANFQSPPQPHLGIEAILILRIVDTDVIIPQIMSMTLVRQHRMQTCIMMLPVEEYCSMNSAVSPEYVPTIFHT